MVFPAVNALPLKKQKTIKQVPAYSLVSPASARHIQGHTVYMDTQASHKHQREKKQNCLASSGPVKGRIETACSKQHLLLPPPPPLC